jgi:glycosyltransferase involved in cell wall biosynthesis
MDKTYMGTRRDNPFRLENKFGERIVVMYSGNHSHIHPLDTLLQAVLKLRDDPDFVFVFIGEGVRKKDVTNFVKQHDLSNVLQLPYQPRHNIHNSLGSSDLQVVIMGQKQVGYTHPNKIYGAMFIGKPVLYIGPDPSHITEILHGIEGNIMVTPDHIEDLVQKLLTFKSLDPGDLERIGNNNRVIAETHFNPEKLKSSMVSILTASESFRTSDD